VHFEKVFCSSDDVSSRSEYLHKRAECMQIKYNQVLYVLIRLQLSSLTAV